MKKKICITFAGPVGSSKTPIAHYLSIKFGLPIFSNDAIRTEIWEDAGKFKEVDYKKIRDKRLKSLIEEKASFILDASIDREWLNFKPWLQKAGYNYFIISLDLSKKILTKFYKLKGYDESLKSLGRFYDDHQLFIRQNKKDIGLAINDKNFKQRLELSRRAVEKWLK